MEPSLLQKDLKNTSPATSASIHRFKATRLPALAALSSHSKPVRAQHGIIIRSDRP